MRARITRGVSQGRLNIMLTGSPTEEVHSVRYVEGIVFDVSFSECGVHLDSTTLNCLISSKDFRKFFRPTNILSWFWFFLYNNVGGKVK